MGPEYIHVIQCLTAFYFTHISIFMNEIMDTLL